MSLYYLKSYEQLSAGTPTISGAYSKSGTTKPWGGTYYKLTFSYGTSYTQVLYALIQLEVSAAGSGKYNVSAKVGLTKGSGNAGTLDTFKLKFASITFNNTTNKLSSDMTLKFGDIPSSSGDSSAGVVATSAYLGPYTSSTTKAASGAIWIYKSSSVTAALSVSCNFIFNATKFTATYDLNGGSGTAPSSETVYYGNTPSNPGTSFSRDTDTKNITCTFNGNGSDIPNTTDTKMVEHPWQCTGWYDLSAMTSDRTIKAQWTGEWTKANFDLKGGFTKSGYTFSYWANPSGGNEGGESGTSATAYSNDVTFTAQWSPVDVSFKVVYGYKDRDNVYQDIGIPEAEFKIKYNASQNITPTTVSGYYNAADTNKPGVYTNIDTGTKYDKGYSVPGSDCLDTNLILYICYNAIPYTVSFSYDSGYTFNYDNPYTFYVYDPKFNIQKFQVYTGDDNVNFARWKDSTGATISDIDPSVEEQRKNYSVIAEFINADVWVKRLGAWTAIANQWVKVNGEWKWKGYKDDTKSPTTQYTKDFFYVKVNGEWHVQQNHTVNIE